MECSVSRQEHIGSNVQVLTEIFPTPAAARVGGRGELHAAEVLPVVLQPSGDNLRADGAGAAWKDRQVVMRTASTQRQIRFAQRARVGVGALETVGDQGQRRGWGRCCRLA